MKKYIYKITNLINNKIYIGQTNNPKRRWQEHKNLGYDTNGTKLLYRAIEKYGKDNFAFEIIEGPIDNYNEKEIYWISYYNTYVGNENSWGYNLTPGGEEPPILYGEENFNSTHTLKEVEQIKYLLKNTKLSNLEIARTFNYSRSAIQRINDGIIWNDDNLEYPIRPEGTYTFLKERADKIKFDLINTNLTQIEIGKKYGVGRTTITAINQGQNYYDKNLSYPLRKTNQQTKSVLMCDKNTGEVLKEFISAEEAARFLGVSRGANIASCARGKGKTAYGYIWKYKEK